MPALIIHGGAGGARTRAAREEIRQSLAGIARAAWSMVLDGAPALDVAVEDARMLEDDPLFNAGLGSKLQSDGAARFSAALMDGEHECFSGVINVEGLLNPIQLCRHLQTARDRVLAGEGALRLARDLGLPEGNVITDAARENWQRALEGETGTIGAVIRDQSGHIAAATSTGGRGGAVGRDDSATVAGNFASPGGGASCTGIGETSWMVPSLRVWWLHWMPAYRCPRRRRHWRPKCAPATGRPASSPWMRRTVGPPCTPPRSCIGQRSISADSTNFTSRNSHEAHLHLRGRAVRRCPRGRTRASAGRLRERVLLRTRGATDARRRGRTAR